MTTDPASLREEMLRTRGRFAPWHEQLLALDPGLLERMHRFVIAAEAGGAIPVKLRHLMWVAVDAVVSHLYPRGVGIHGAQAIANGASVAEVVEALSLACAVTLRTTEHCLPVLLDEVRRARKTAPGEGESGSTGPVVESGEARLAPPSQEHAAFVDRYGDVPDWMHQALQAFPDYVRALVPFGYGPARGGALDERSRELILLAVHACPAVVDVEATRRHARRCLELDATVDELLETLKIASAIGPHTLSVGVPALMETMTSLERSAGEPR